MFVTAAKPLRPLINLILFVAVCFASCSTVKNAPANKPFVYQTNIALNGKFNTDERKDLLAKLQDQLHDSIRVRRVQKLVFWNVLKNPPVYDSLNADKSVQFMRALLNAQGYYRDTITYDTTLHVVATNKGTQYRTTVNFSVYPGKLIRLDSISYRLGRDTLQQITLNAQGASLLKKGVPFAKNLISNEFDRLTDVYRNNGYLRFSREELLGVWDTVGIALLRPTLDPIEQAQQLEELRRRRLNPTADLEVRLRANPDTSHLIRYYVGNVTIYPDLSADTSAYIAQESTLNDYQIIEYRDLYKNRILAENVYLHRGDMYSQRNYLKTLNRFNSIGSWRLVSVDQIPRGNTDTADFVIRLTPAEKYSFNANIEGSQSIGGNSIFTTGNLIGLNLGLQNRNFARGANLATTNFRFATELLSNKFVQTKQISLTNTIYFPRLLPRFGFVPPALKENVRTVFSFNPGYTSRKDYFDLRSLNLAWGYDFTWKKYLLTVRLPNIELSDLNRGDSLIKMIENNRSYAFIYPSGLVTSAIGNLTMSGGKGKNTNITRFGLEVSGLLTGLVHTEFLKNNLHRFIKADVEFRQNHKIRNNAFAWRTFAGIGYQLSSNYFKYDSILPFYKSYIAGGANSMRAWTLRRLGPGSVIRSFDPTESPERYGDMQLEANAEYRFYLGNINGVTINSALFTDMGNIWLLRNIPGLGGDSAVFKLNKLWHDLAIGAGTGLRIDFGFLLIRLDLGIKLKDPSPDSQNAALQNKFFPYRRLNAIVPQLGVTYPF